MKTMFDEFLGTAFEMLVIFAFVALAQWVFSMVLAL